MKDSITSERGLQSTEQGDYIPKKPKKICVKVYLNLKSFQAIALDAEKAGKRRGGLLLFTQKAHGFAGETISNTDGISKFLKFCWVYWQENEASRLEARADILRREIELSAEKKRLGF